MNPGVLSIIVAVARLAPELRGLVLDVVRSIGDQDQQAARRAFEAALRAQFALRQRR